MHGFVFKSGDTLLDGYTVEQPLGHGGFGEVYHARSAAGKDVALKLIQRFLEVELRGVGHCLNLKHPHLVTIYDVRPDSDGRQWIVMEYVAGESLSDAVQKHPDGMPVEEALRWFEPICQAVEHLHQSGIVHRDLKPGNIFDDRGTVKVGDYGLAKFITASKRSAQTQSVGTLHYMAPEVGSGRYGREVDVYAVGIILYEMLTGRVPFDGETPAEILMKHLTSRPDLEKLPVAFRGVVARMLAKNPNDRYGSVLSALNDLKAKIADHAHGEAIGEPSQYPAYEESVVSRPGMSDWLEAPFGFGRAEDQRAGTDQGASPAGSFRLLGRVLERIGQRPVLAGICVSLTLAVFLMFGLALGIGTEPGAPTAIFLLPFLLLAACAVTAWAFLLRDSAASRPGRPAPFSHPRIGERPRFDQPQRKIAAEFAPTVIAGEFPGDLQGAARAMSAPRDPAAVLSELDTLDREWDEYRAAHLQRKRDGSFDVPGVEESRAAIAVAIGICALLAAGSVVGAILSGTIVFFALMLLATLVLAWFMLVALLRQLRVAHVYPRSLSNYRTLRQRLMRELPEDERAAAKHSPTMPLAPPSSESAARTAETWRSRTAVWRMVGILVWVAAGTAGIALAIGFRDPVGVLLISGGVLLVATLIALIARGRPRAALGIVLLLAAISAVFASWSSTDVRHATPATVVPDSIERPDVHEHADGHSSPLPIEFSEFTDATSEGLAFRSLYPGGWKADASREADLLRVRFEAPDGQTTIELRQVPNDDLAAAREAASTAAGTDGAFVLARHLHDQLRDPAREQLTTGGLIGYSQETTRIDSRSPAGGIFTDRFFATAATDGELIHGLRTTWYDGRVGLQVICLSRNVSQAALEPILDAMLSSITVTQAG